MPPRKTSSKNTVSGAVDGVVLQDVRADQIQVQQIRRDATPQEQRDQEVRSARLHLQNSIRQKCEDWREQISRQPSPGGNPYRFLTPLGPAEADRLAGRAAEIAHVLQAWRSAPTQFVSGADGIGKTSLILAGLIPHLVQAGHLPLYVEAGHLPLEPSIKRQLLPDLAAYPFLQTLPLAAFLHEVSALLPRGKSLYVLVDRLEVFCDQSESDRLVFKDEWALAVSSAAPDVRWLFGLQVSHIHGLNFFAPQVQPFSVLTVLPPLSRDAGREILVAAALDAHIQIEPPLVDALLDDWQKEPSDPLRLQLAGYSLAGAGGPLVTDWRLAEYEQRGRLSGILRGYLEQALQELPPKERTPAWQILSAMLENGGKASQEWLEDYLKPGGLDALAFRQIAETLKLKHIICMEDGCYRLSSVSLHGRIEQWQAQQAARQQVRQEFNRQVRHIRNSALRGLLVGGLLGFPVFATLAYPGNLLALNPLLAVFFVILTVTIGGLTGLFITLGVDVTLAVYSSRASVMRYFIAAAGGMLTMWLALLAYIGLFADPQSFAYVLLQSLLAGGPWGAMLGVGIMRAKAASHNPGLIVVLLALFCGGWLAGLEAGTAFLGGAPALLAGLGGFWFSLCMAAVSLVGRRLPGGTEI